MKFEFNMFGDEYWKKLGEHIDRLSKETDRLFKETMLLEMKTDKALIIEGIAINFCEYKGENG